jgi:hypothetical protein
MNNNPNDATNDATETLSQQQMVALLDDGSALALQLEGVPGPMQLDGRWWIVPTTEQNYRPVTDEQQINQLNRAMNRLRRARFAALRVGDQ